LTTRLPQSEPALLAGHELACVRGGRLVVAGVSFALTAGDALVLRGANGSGKSSLLRLLAGFLRSAEGELSWGGEPVAADLVVHRARLHYVGHLDGLKPALTAGESLAFAAALAGAGPERVEVALAAFELLPLVASPVRFLSSGQRRRLALARLIAAERPLWLLDEPGVGLDRASRLRLEAAIAAHCREGGLCIVASHGDVALESPLVLDLDG
jgi:heme exporter protein A